MTPVIDKKMPLSSKYSFITDDDGTYGYCEVTYQEFIHLKILLSKYYCQKIHKVIKFAYKKPLSNSFKYEYFVFDKMKNFIIKYEKKDEDDFNENSPEFTRITFYPFDGHHDSFLYDKMVLVLSNEGEIPLSERDINLDQLDSISESEEHEDYIFTQSQKDFENKEN